MPKIAPYLTMVFFFTSTILVSNGTLVAQELVAQDRPALTETVEFVDKRVDTESLTASTPALFIFDSVRFSIDHLCDNLVNRLYADVDQTLPTERPASPLLASEEEQWSQQSIEQSQIVSRQSAKRFKITQELLERLKK